MRKSLLCLLLLAALRLSAQSELTLKFTSVFTDGSYCPFEEVKVTNLSRGWDETLTYPDTTLVLSYLDGVGELGISSALEVFPNPFNDCAHVAFDLREAGAVQIQVFQLSGKQVCSYEGYLVAGSHLATVRLDGPQMALLSITTKDCRRVAKLIHTGQGGANAIEVIPIERKRTASQREAFSVGEFAPGDTMRYEAVAHYDGNVLPCEAVVQSQYEDETIIFSFEKPHYEPEEIFTVNGATFKMKLVEGGTYYMGAQSSDPDGLNYDPDAHVVESPVHQVTLNTFYMGECEVTQELWIAVMGYNPSIYVGLDRPVDNVSWNDVVNGFIPALNALTGRTFRLPTESEWEFAASGGNLSHGYRFAGSNDINEVGWYGGNGGSQSHPVMMKAPNELGLYDMSGNAQEWCSDWHGPYPAEPQVNPQGPDNTGYKETRGGSWAWVYAKHCRVSYRYFYEPIDADYDIGFRLALVPEAGSTTNGVFSVSDHARVYFSPGNLQYIGSATPPYWKFADHQWDYLGNNGQGEPDEHLDRDLFGWGTSGWDNGNLLYQPWNTENTNTTYYGPLDDSDLTGDYANADWGVYNPISNGGNQEGMWRTLTADEWLYVLETRTTASGYHYAKAVVSDHNGVILVPDNWNVSYYNLVNTDQVDAEFASNHVSASEWFDIFEAHGAIFLPAAGSRFGSMVMYSETHGVYWTASSAHDNLTAHDVNFDNTNFKTWWSMFKYFGNSVRLVRDVPVD